MTGLNAHSPLPTELHVRTQSRVLEIAFDDGQRFHLPFEYLRVFSPSAEVRGHGPGPGILQTGKRNVTVLALEPVGHYAVQPHFSDGHHSGLYSWDYLYELGQTYAQRWAGYLEQLERAGASRD